MFAAKGTYDRAAEVAAREMLRWTLRQIGLPADTFDLNEIRKDFPGLDLISRAQPWQVKATGVHSKRTRVQLAKADLQDMLGLYGTKPWRQLPTTTAKALLGSYEVIARHGAWPAALALNSTLEEVGEYLKTTVFAVPSDRVPLLRSFLGQLLAEQPKAARSFRSFA